MKRLEKEKARQEKRLAALDRDFHKNLELLKKELINEQEFSRANEKQRDDRTATETGLAELRTRLDDARFAVETVSTLPQRVRSFTESFEGLDTPRAKAILQTILKAAYVWNDNRIELEFR